MRIISSIKAKLWAAAGGGRFWSVLAFALPALVYVASLPRTTSFEDSAEFVTAAATLGIPHPSGYPLYVLLAHPFSWLPFGTMPWRITLFSAVVGALTIWLAHDLSIRLAKQFKIKLTVLRRLAIWSALMAVAFSGLWWSQAVYAKMYGLHAGLTVLSFWLLLLAVERRRCRWVILACGALGLSLANHFSLALIQAPFFYLALYYARPEFFQPKNWKLWFAADGLTLAGLGLPYLWLYLRAQGSPPYMMGEVSGWSGLLDLMLRRGYGDIGLAAWNKFGLFFGIIGQLALYIGIVVFLVAAVGWWRAASSWRQSRGAKVLVLAVLGSLLAAPAAMLFRQLDLSGDSLYVARVYALAAYPFLGVAAALGAIWLIGLFKLKRGSSAVFFLGLLILFVPFYQWSRSRLAIPAYTHPFPYEHSKAILQSLPADAVLLVNDSAYVHDTTLFTLAYLQTVEGLRPDVTVMEDSGINSMVRPQVPKTAYHAKTPLDSRRSMMMRAALTDDRFAGRPLFATYPAEAVGEPLRSMSNGLAFAISRPGEPPPESRTVPHPELPPFNLLQEQPALAQQVAHYHYVNAAYLLDDRGMDAASRELVNALYHDSWPMSQDYQAFMAYRATRLRPNGGEHVPWFFRD